MTRFETLPALPTMPDFAVLTKAQTSAPDRRVGRHTGPMHRERTGPPRIQLSARRIGYPVGASAAMAGPARQSGQRHRHHRTDAA